MTETAFNESYLFKKTFNFLQLLQGKLKKINYLTTPPKPLSTINAVTFCLVSPVFSSRTGV